MKKPVLALILPDGITLRNFVFSTFLENAAASFSIVIFHYPEKDVFNELPENLRERISFQKIVTFRENPLTKAFRYAKQKASLVINNRNKPNPTFLRNYPDYKRYSAKEQIVFWLANFMALPSKQRWVQFLEKCQIFAFKWGNRVQINNAKIQLSQHGVAIVLNAHQRDVKSLPYILAAQILHVPNVNFIYSWDNLPKGRMAVPAQFFFVWSDYMKSEMKYYYPDVSDNRVMITGTPQFEFYHTVSPTSREELAQKYGLDPAKRWIIYTGDMTDASPYDQYYLEDVYEAWQNSPYKNSSALLFRRAPTDLTGRFAEVLERCKEIVEIPTLWTLSGTHQMSLMVSKADVKLLVDVVAHCETAVNFGSTMAHDFAQKGKQVFYLNYNHPAVDKEKWRTEIFYAYTHFESMQGLHAANWINSKEELAKLFGTTTQKATDCVAWHQRITAPTTRAVSEMVAALNGLVHNNTTDE